MPVPVHLVAGFLGAGKTTVLLDQLHRRRGRERLAFVVNDFGQAGFDAQQVEEAGGLRVASIEGACVCCTAPAGFLDAVGLLLREAAPERVFIEPSGLARPADLLDLLQRGPHRDALAVQPVVVLVDPAALLDRDPSVQALLAEQAAVADVLVANRKDLATPAQLEDFDRWAKDLWPGPLSVLHTAHGRLPDEALAWPPGTGPRAPDHQRHDLPGHDSHERTFTWSSEAVFSRERLSAALQGAPILRAKGLFRTQEGVLELQLAGGRLDERPSAWRRDSRADVFVRAGDQGALAALDEDLRAALLTPQELAPDPTRLEVVLPGGRRRLLDRAELLALPGAVADVSALVPGRSGAAARVSALLEGLAAPAAGQLVAIAADGFATPPLRLEVARTGLLLHSVDGRALEPGQGGPYRLLLPPGSDAPPSCAAVKGVVRLMLRAES